MTRLISSASGLEGVVLARLLRLDGLLNQISAGFLGGSAREVVFGPDEPRAHALVLSQRLVGGCDDRFAGSLRASESVRARARHFRRGARRRPGRL